MMTPQMYFQINFQGKTNQEIDNEIKNLKEQIATLKEIIAEGDNINEIVSPSYEVQLSCCKEYLKYALKRIKKN